MPKWSPQKVTSADSRVRVGLMRKTYSKTYFWLVLSIASAFVVFSQPSAGEGSRTCHSTLSKRAFQQKVDPATIDHQLEVNASLSGLFGTPRTWTPVSFVVSDLDFENYGFFAGSLGAAGPTVSRAVARHLFLRILII